MLQFTTVSDAGRPFLQKFPPSASKLIVVNVAGGPPATANADGSIASAKSKLPKITPIFLIPTITRNPLPWFADGSARIAAAEVRPAMAGRTYRSQPVAKIPKSRYVDSAATSDARRVMGRRDDD
jgi:hypothetical protein